MNAIDVVKLDILTPEGLTIFASAVLSICFGIVPKLKAWFEAKSKREKQLWMIGFMGLITVIVTGLSCSPLAEYLSVDVTCSKEGIVLAFRVFALAAISNVVTFSSTKYITDPERA